MARDARRRVLVVGVDADDHDVLVGVGVVQLGQARHEGVVDGTFGAHEDDDDGLLVGNVGERPGFAVEIFQGEVRDGLPDAAGRLGLFGLRLAAGQGDEREQQQ